MVGSRSVSSGLVGYAVQMAGNGRLKLVIFVRQASEDHPPIYSGLPRRIGESAVAEGGGMRPETEFGATCVLWRFTWVWPR